LKKEDIARHRKATKYDVSTDIPFRCLIGKTDAELHIMIEPDPHGDERGTHSHFHALMMCPNMKIVDVPEPDRCKITDNTCPFIAPLGSDERNPELRKFRYANEIIQKIASIEFYGSQFVNEILRKKKLAPIQYNLRVAELEKILVVSDLIDVETYRKVGILRRMRNKLAHSPKEYLKFSERDLYECSREADRLSYVFADLLKNTSKKKT
jgi:hypothetical protein